MLKQLTKGNIMKIKNFFVIFSLFIIFACCIGAISAVSDDVMMDNSVSEVDISDEPISVKNDEQAIGVDTTEPASNAQENSNEIEKLANSQDDSQLTKDQSDEILSATIYSSWCKIDLLNDEYEIQSNKAASIKYTREPFSAAIGETYDFHVCIIDINKNIHYNKQVSGTSKESGTFTYTIPKNSIAPGTYVLAFIDSYTDETKDYAILKVKGTGVITANDYNSIYMSGAPMTAKIVDKDTGKPISAIDVKVTFTNGKTTVTNYYVPNINGVISFIPPVGIGTWTVSFTSNQANVNTGTVVKTAVITKAPVTVKAQKVTEYKGFKTTLKATVKSNGKNVNEGTVKFKINGKSYSAPVKNGVATAKVNLKKAKKYKYTAQFTGNNFAKAKNSKAKATLKNRVGTKIILKNQRRYTDESKYINIKVRTADGHKVKNGQIKINSRGHVTYGPVKKGKVKALSYGMSTINYRGKTATTTYYKHAVTVPIKLKYIPGSHKYKSSKKKIKSTSIFRCTCGRTSSHYHYYRGYYGIYRHLIHVS